MGPVFLFDVSVVVFVIGSAAGELDGFLPVDKMSLEVIVEELTSVIGIEAEDREREVFFDVFDLFQDSCFALSPYGTLLSPSGGDIYEVDGIGEHTGGGIAAMGDGIGFEEARACFVPLIGFDGYLFS